MALTTDNALRSAVIYSIYVRAHTQEGTFRAIHADLDRIRDLGTDIIWFLPIHPIGIEKKKGSLGCPYANRDYRTVNPEYGTLEDFRALVDAIHHRGMKVIIDVVYNHTSPDSTLAAQHPEFFHRRSDGSMGNRVGDWTDIVDLDYRVPELWDYQIDSLKFWASMVDGFRCDVAPLVDLEFWCRARAEVETVRPGCIWLAETSFSSDILNGRLNGIPSSNDYDMYRAFDLEYDYDTRHLFERYLAGNCRLSHYLDLLNYQECQFPANYNKLRFLENHDQPRIRSLVPDDSLLETYTAFLYFLKGTTLLYGGQEFSCCHRPSLFEKEVFSRTGRDISPLLSRLNIMKKTLLSPEDIAFYSADDDRDIALCLRTDGAVRKLGIFSLKGNQADVAVPFPDGTYRNCLSGSHITVSQGRLHCDGSPIVILLNT